MLTEGLCAENLSIWWVKANVQKAMEIWMSGLPLCLNDCKLRTKTLRHSLSLSACSLFSFFPFKMEGEKGVWIMSVAHSSLSCGYCQCSWKRFIQTNEFKNTDADNLCLQTEHGLEYIWCDDMISENIACHDCTARHNVGSQILRTIKKRLISTPT